MTTSQNTQTMTGAATDEGLRARVEALAADFDRRWATMSVREVAAALHALARADEEAGS